MTDLKDAAALTEEESRGTHQWAIDLALTDLQSAAADFFKLWPELREFKVEKQDNSVWVILPSGVKHGFGPARDGIA